MTLSAIVNGTEYSLDDGSLCYWVGDDGLGMAPMHRLSERGPLQHGNTDRGYRLDPRDIRLILDIIAITQTDFESARLSLLSIFKPSSNPIILQLAMANNTYRLNCHYVGQANMSSNDRIGWNQTVVVDLVANDPTFYDPTGLAHSFAISAGSDTLEIPMSVPFTVGASTISATEAITNGGSVDAYPQIRIVGPITDPVITNNTTGEKLDFTGITIAAGDYYDIDLRYGYKTIEDSSDTNKISELTTDSDLVSWHLGCDPDLPDGINSITISGTSCTEATAINFAWFNRYIGI